MQVAAAGKSAVWRGKGRGYLRQQGKKTYMYEYMYIHDDANSRLFTGWFWTRKKTKGEAGVKDVSCHPVSSRVFSIHTDVNSRVWYAGINSSSLCDVFQAN
jgi:hypothetical protein